jgi:hypothetical protein
MLTKHEDDEDRRRVFRHGEKLRVDMMLMDSVQRAVAAETSGSVAD